jgi:ADP-heptose:LPS heptosyltransferase
VERIHDFDRSSGPLQQIRGLRSLPGPYDLLIVMEYSSYFAQLARFAPARRRLGFSNRMDWLYDAHLQWNPREHAIRNNLELVGLAGVAEEHRVGRMELVLPEEDLELADLHLSNEGLEAGRPFVVFHPPCGAQDPLRPWPNFYYAELADRLQNELGHRVLINGGPNEAHIVDAVVAQSTTPVLTNTDPSLGLMMAIIARSALFVGGDTGPLQMASALDRPVLGLFGTTSPGDPSLMGPPHRVRFLSAGFPCSPCANAESPERSICLQKGIADCMVALTVDEVFDGCRALLSSE